MLLVDMIREAVAPDSRSFRSDIVTAEKKVAMTLYHYLKNQGSFRQTGNSFGVSKATLSITLRVVVNAIINNLRKKYIALSSNRADLEKAAGNFEKKFGFTHVIGCVDGTHIPIIQQKANSHDYFCYKMKYSLNCQAVRHEKGQFIDVEVKWPGSVHDARVYANSSINKKFSNKEFPSRYRELLPGHVGVPPILLGDPAYLLLPNVMKEFNKCTETKHVLFNYKLRATRNEIECAFGRLKSRWRILNRVVGVDINFAVKLVSACFILHNFC